MKNFTSINKWPFFYGFVIAIVGTLGIWASVPGQTVGVSTFTDPIKEALGLDRPQISLAYALGTIGSSLLLGIAGKWFDKYGARKVAFGAAIGLAIALFISSKSADISNSLQTFLGIQNWLFSFIVIMICFFLIRFTGQGVLTLSSRNMIMIWFDQYRGRVNAVSSIAVSLGFSISPLWINLLIEGYGWQDAWLWMSIGLLVIGILIYATFRDSPEKYGMVPDGHIGSHKEKKKQIKPVQEFTRGQALKTRAFWMYGLMLAFNGYFITGLTFHIISIFGDVGYSKQEALSFFLPMSIVSLTVSVLGNAISDKTKFKYLLYAMIFGSATCSVGLAILKYTIGFYLLIGGVGIMGGMFAVLSSVVWPRFFGRKHLGAISGVSMQMIVFSSALGPFMFSLSYNYLGSYSYIALAGLVSLALIAIGSVKADNPQESLES
ncbi:MFS transporter [Plebeiibacterium sediminum]|uniref:MFS transporter n=1 Tax=Plebeiibacterium sediminum TaxID=2992112 RepID=A0AAE3M9F1_9BACT|nr:MFS transporter [Plebeiobacterium sediminum]MCW3789264.1 MFS transporter [Plebeiobacterium sediminum]